ncbi:hypothetical protein IEQ34_013124 [Dendrobium chrysotoxum]|uniref:Uncharacterized protein n=1 Tax=Dendrobium chrysotoxum TaxID=161865 RepID=A0AAV7GQ44_DENCH|nr:hypothetical protein IEQ34_013124 [Dendrobium chrysotoxum]
MYSQAYDGGKGGKVRRPLTETPCERSPSAALGIRAPEMPIRQIGQGRLDIPETMDNVCSTCSSLGSPQALIWGRSVLDSDYTSFGPIQRIRQKSNLISAAKDARLVPSSSRYGSSSQFSKDYSAGSTSSQKPCSANEVNYGRPSLQISENGDNKQSLLDIPPILGQSSELAWKMLEKLDKFVLSPEEKSNMKNKCCDESLSKLATDMLHCQAFECIQNVDTSQFVNASCASDFSEEEDSLHFKDYHLDRLGKTEENIPSKPAVTGVKFATAAIGMTKTATFNSSEATISAPATLFSQRKPAFQMTVPEDSLELDDELDVVDAFVQFTSSKTGLKFADIKASDSGILLLKKPLGLRCSSIPYTFGLNNSSSPGFTCMPLGTTSQSAKPFVSTSGFSLSCGTCTSSNSGVSSSSSTGVSSSSFGFSSIATVSSSFGFSSIATGSSTSSYSFNFSASADSCSSARSTLSPAVILALFDNSFVVSTPSTLGSMFGSSPSTATATPTFGMPTAAEASRSASQNNDQTDVEDPLADETYQAPTPMVPTSVQPNSSSAFPNFVLGSAVPSGGTPVIQFGSNQNPNPFQVGGSLGSAHGGSFLSGQGVCDKSSRKIMTFRSDKTPRKTGLIFTNVFKLRSIIINSMFEDRISFVLCGFNNLILFYFGEINNPRI